MKKPHLKQTKTKQILLALIKVRKQTERLFWLLPKMVTTSTKNIYAIFVTLGINIILVQGG